MSDAGVGKTAPATTGLFKRKKRNVRPIETGILKISSWLNNIFCRQYDKYDNLAALAFKKT